MRLSKRLAKMKREERGMCTCCTNFTVSMLAIPCINCKHLYPRKNRSYWHWNGATYGVNQQ